MTETEYNNLPQPIKNIVDSWEDARDLYVECRRIKKELESIGWTCDYDLSGQVYDVQPIS